MYRVIFIASRKGTVSRRLIVRVVMMNKHPIIRLDVSVRIIEATTRNPKKKIVVRIPPIIDTGLSGYSSVPYHCLFRWRIEYIIKVVPVITIIPAKRNRLTFLRLLCDIKVVSRIIRVAKGMVAR